MPGFDEVDRSFLPKRTPLMEALHRVKEDLPAELHAAMTGEVVDLHPRPEIRYDPVQAAYFVRVGAMVWYVTEEHMLVLTDERYRRAVQAAIDYAAKRRE